MKQRGRKSVESKQLTPALKEIAAKRPAPPSELGAEAASVWHVVVSGYPAGYFRKPEHDLLVSYCRHTVESRRLSKLIESLPDESIKDLATQGLTAYTKLLRARDAEVRAATALARAMRITHQSRENRNAAAKVATQMDREEQVRAVWDFE